ncbi:hypothetical protein [Paenibacillus sp. UNC499MF]|uniref:hypothetical protein n=1 Tax=Paenibacillus sp. UNC499MF TaxID=1502751 RepID=UPI00089FCD8D|nr:hypothetical protein [Paenibacillus sp. UNC499MF]SEG35025.1 hypothetical protein SAMN02799616_02599 [Paenibacillus sp. UNC499MF]
MKSQIFKKWWFWVIVVVFIGALANNNNSDKEKAEAAPKQQPAATPAATQPPADAVVQKEAPATATPAPTDAKKEADKKETSDNKFGNIGITANQFKTAFNKAAAEFKSDLKIGSLKVEDGAVQNTFSTKLTEHLYVNGSVNKSDGKLREVYVLGNGDGTPKSGADLMVSFGLIVTATNPNLSADERGTVFKDLGLIGDNVDIKKLDKSIVRKNIKYTIKYMDQIGFMFIASDPNEK